MKSNHYLIAAASITVAVIAFLLAITVWYFDVPHAPVEKVVELHGETDAKIFSRLGKPTHESSFTMDAPLSEFQIELYNEYKEGSPNNSNVEIRECTWVYSRYRLTVWFHKPNGNWIALDTCRYRNGIYF